MGNIEVTLMKEFIYLDTGFLHSFIAQQNNGLPSSHSTEFQESESKSSTTGKSNELQNEMDTELKTGELKFPGLFESPSGKVRYKLAHKRGTSSSITLNQLEAGKEIISKQLHDNALQQFEDYLIENELLKEASISEDAMPGEYVKIKGAFSIVDLKDINNILNPTAVSTALGFAMETALDNEIAQMEELGVTSQQRQRRIKEYQETQKKETKAMSEQLAKFQILIQYMESILPSSAFLKTDRYTCPLRIEYLRESAKELAFKYKYDQTMPITIIGKYTKKFERFAQLSRETNNGPFGVIGDSINAFDQAFETFGIFKKGDLIVSPVAIYFE